MEENINSLIYKEIFADIHDLILNYNIGPMYWLYIKN